MLYKKKEKDWLSFNSIEEIVFEDNLDLSLKLLERLLSKVTVLHKVAQYTSARQPNKK